MHAAFAPQPYVIVAAANHPLAARHRIPMSVLCREPFLVREKGSDTAASMAEGFGRWLSKVPIAMEIRSTETIKQAVIAGLGIAFLSAHTVAQERQIGSLVVLDVEGFPLMLNWYVVHRKQKRLPPIAAEFVDFLLAEGDSMLEDITRLPPAPMRAAKKPAARSRAVGARKQSSRPFT